MRSAISVVTVGATLLLGGSAHGDEDDHDPMAEPLIGETITDIDGEEVGEGELDLTGVAARRLDGSNIGSGELELEVKLTRRLGVNLAAEPGGDDTRPVGAVGLRGGASFALLHDHRRDFHLVLEGTALIFGGQFATLKRDDTGARYTVGLRAGWRRGWLTTRYGFGLALGGAKPVPLWAAIAILGEWGRHGRRSFAGIEAVSDWSSDVPVIVSPEVALGFQVRRLPLRIGVGLPISIGYRRADISVAGLLRIMFEIEGS